MMTLLSFIVAMSWPLVVGYGLWRAFGIVERELAARRPATPLDADDLIPDDLIGFVAGYEDAWAQEDVTRVIKEKYAETKNWNHVRRAFGLAPREDKEATA